MKSSNTQLSCSYLTIELYSINLIFRLCIYKMRPLLNMPSNNDVQLTN